jgi:hypothetical protein
VLDVMDGCVPVEAGGVSLADIAALNARLAV